MDRDIADIIETLTDRLRTSTLLEDRRDACRGLRSLAKDYRVEVGAQAMEQLLQTIRDDKHDVQVVNYCLDSLNYIIAGRLADSSAASWPDLDQDALAAEHDPGRELADIFLKRSENVATIVDTIGETDLKIRRVVVKILSGLARYNLESVQESILSGPLNLSRLLELLSDQDDVTRNDTLVLFVHLTKNNQNIQNVLAYENCFDRIMFIIESEGHLTGTNIAIVKDCLNIILNLIHMNESNQVLFREGNNIQKLMPFFEFDQTVFDVDQEATDPIGLNEMTACIILVTQIVDSLIVSSNADNVRRCQEIMQRCGLLSKLFNLLAAPRLPIGVQDNTLNTACDTVRGYLGPNIMMSIMPTSSMLPILLLSRAKEMHDDQEKRLQDQEREIQHLKDSLSELHNYINVIYNFILSRL